MSEKIYHTTLQLTQEQAKDILFLITTTLITEALSAEYASRLNDLTRQLTGKKDSLFLSLGPFPPNTDALECESCGLKDPEVTTNEIDQTRCPKHQSGVDPVMDALEKLFAVTELAAHYMPGELADSPDLVLSHVGEAADILEANGRTLHWKKINSRGVK